MKRIWNGYESVKRFFSLNIILKLFKNLLTGYETDMNRLWTGYETVMLP